MSKVKTNPTYRKIAKMLKNIEKSNEVFIETNFYGQEHRQTIRYPEGDYLSSFNSIFIEETDNYNSYELSLNHLTEIVDDSDGIEPFSYCLYFDENNYVKINNEW